MGADSTLSDTFGPLGPLGVFVVCNPGATDPAGACDAFSSNVSFNGDDAMELVCDGVTQDVFGEIGFFPSGGYWGTTVITQDVNLSRDCSVDIGDRNGFDAFEPAAQWYERVDIYEDLGAHFCP